MTSNDPLTDCLLGGAVGDALGLPAEGLSAARIARMWPGPLRHRFFFGKGMFSDDTEHAVMTVMCLLRHGDHPAHFANDLGRRLRWWFAGIPAGIGLATVRSILKLWIGFGPSRSGVWSAGNGPLMRAPVIGVHFHDNPESRLDYTDISTRITHTDPRAIEGARLIAEASSMAAGHIASTPEILDSLENRVESDEMKLRFPLLRVALAEELDVPSFADRFGRRKGFVSGFAPDTAATALFAWLRHRGDFRATVESVVRAGGDTDTVAFVAGALAGIDVGAEGIPSAWLSGLRDQPIQSILTNPAIRAVSRYPNWPFSLLRNAWFLTIVLGHAFRRALPPY